VDTVAGNRILCHFPSTGGLKAFNVIRIEVKKNFETTYNFNYDTLYPQKLALTSPTSGSRTVGIVRSRSEATEFVLFLV
jgi:hypothetical protein